MNMKKQAISALLTIVFMQSITIHATNDGFGTPFDGNKSGTEAALKILIIAGISAIGASMTWVYKKLANQEDCLKQEIQTLKHEINNLDLKSEIQKQENLTLQQSVELQKIRNEQVRALFKQCKLKLNEQECKRKPEFAEFIRQQEEKKK